MYEVRRMDLGNFQGLEVRRVVGPRRIDRTVFDCYEGSTVGVSRTIIRAQALGCTFFSLECLGNGPNTYTHVLHTPTHTDIIK